MKLLIADDHGMMRDGLKSLIEDKTDMQVIGEAKNGEQTVQLAKELSPDIIIMDISMPILNGADAARLILKDNPNAKIIALSMHDEKRFVIEMLKAGALGYVLKSYYFDELLRAIEAVWDNGYYLSPKITDVVMEDYINNQTKTGITDEPELTNRESQIVQLVTEGLSSKQIALRLNISRKTVDATRHRAMYKLEIDNIADLTKYAIRTGLTTEQ